MPKARATRSPARNTYGVIIARRSRQPTEPGLPLPPLIAARTPAIVVTSQAMLRPWASRVRRMTQGGE
jgi:hypothetical protein